MMTEWEKTKKSIEEAPLSWLPALLVIAVQTCIRRKVFKSAEALARVVQQTINKTDE